MDGSGEGKVLSKTFQWKEFPDGTMEFRNDLYYGRGYFVVVAYAGSSDLSLSASHDLRVGATVGVKKGRCWKVRDEDASKGFDCYGVAMGWYEDTDGVFVQVSGTIKAIGSKWYAGGKVHLPQAYGPPEQLPPRFSNGVAIGLALNEKDLLLVAGMGS